MGNKFIINERVQVIGNKERVGIVTDIKKLQDSIVYTVFFNATDIKEINEKDLIPPGYKPSSITDKILLRDFIEVKDFSAVLTLRKIQIPLTTNIYSYLASRTQFYALQFKPLLKFLNSNYHRILIADEVGVGKTIEAGIIFTEMKARLEELDKVLIICPSYLLQRKWQDEMYSRFDKDFRLVDGDDLKTSLKDWQNQSRFRGIISLPLLRREEYIDLLVEIKPDFDLIIVDEAHHFRNVNTNTYHLGELLSSLANIMIFLTATPIHISNTNLFNLLHLLIPQEFANEAAFHLIIQPNKYINEAISYVKRGSCQKALEPLSKLKGLALKGRFVENPIYEETLRLLTDYKKHPREVRVKIVSNLQDLNTLSHVVTRTKKRDFPAEFPVREPYVISVKLDPSELDFYDAVYAYARNRSQRLSAEGHEIPFLTVMIRRRAASCLPALLDYFKKILDVRQYVYDAEEIDEELFENRAITKKNIEDYNKLFEEDIEDIMNLVNVGENIIEKRKDTKFEMFGLSLVELFNQDVSKIIVFSFFKDTLNYLNKNLQEIFPSLQIGLIHGEIPFEDREKIIGEFKETQKKFILLSSEVGGEGLDLQFCSCMFNYDLPWNPMRVEQPIGRIDRIGQLKKKIMIYNFSVKDTIEEIILERLYQRINLFKESLGDLEEILGEELDGIMKSIFNPSLTKQQVENELERIADSIVIKQESHKRFDEERDKILGQDNYFTEQITKIGEEKRFISGEELENLYHYFIGGNFIDSKLRNKPGHPKEYILKAGPALQEFLIDNIIRGHSPGRKERALAAKVRNAGGFLLTFSQELACINKDIEFASVTHPITKAIINYYKNSINQKFASFIKLKSNAYDVGVYYFTIYLIKTNGYTESLSLFPVVLETSSGIVNSKLSQAFFLNDYEKYMDSYPPFEKKQLDGFDKIAFEHLNQFCDSKRSDFEGKNKSLIDIRSTSLEQTYKVLLEQISSFIMNQNDQKILRMKLSQRENLLLKKEKQLAELESKKQVSMETEDIAGGLLLIEQE